MNIEQHIKKELYLVNQKLVATSTAVLKTTKTIRLMTLYPGWSGAREKLTHSLNYCNLTSNSADIRNHTALHLTWSSSSSSSKTNVH